MEKNNSVIFKGRRDGITILLDEVLPFDEIRDALAMKMRDAQKFFGTATSSVTFKGRELSEAEENALLDIIVKSSNLSITFARNAAGQTMMSATEPKRQEEIPEVVPQLSPTEHMTHFHKGALRSGQSIHYAGSVVLMGDVNPGAEIVAEGNIIVLGAVKGLVHAGCSGNRECYVSSFVMQPTQLRIADLITYVPKEMLKPRGRAKTVPVQAYIHNGQIFIEALVQ